ncbi:MAG: HIT family protein [Pseudomonadales bacterium]
MDYQQDNVFARILRGELPAHRVYEDEQSLAFMDIMPQAEGHTLVIPKCPAVDLFDVPADVLRGTMETTQLVARAVKRAFAAEGVMIAQLSGAAAGQTVFHLHFHILPRHAGVDFRMHARDMAPTEMLEEHARRVRAALVELQQGSA